MFPGLVYISLTKVVRISKQRELIALNRPKTKKLQQRLEFPAATLPGMRVNTGYMNSYRGISSHTHKKKDIYVYIASISGTLGETGVYRHASQMFIRDRM